MPDVPERLEVNRCRFLTLPTIIDLRGQLLVAELAAMPFSVRRVFFVSRVPPGVVRGGHAYESGAELLVAINGSVAVNLDDGTRRAEVILRHPGLGLVVGPMIWCTQSQFSEDAILGVFASLPYDPSNYVSEYAKFQSMIA